MDERCNNGLCELPRGHEGRCLQPVMTAQSVADMRLKPVTILGGVVLAPTPATDGEKNAP